MKRRFLALVLALSLALGLLPFSALAAEEPAARDSGTNRYTVLLLDCSGSMSGTPMLRMKEAAAKFVQSVLQADGQNYVALISFTGTAVTRATFSNDEAALTKAINALSAIGGTNIHAALTKADDLFKSAGISETDAVKNIVLLSDGLPESGSAVSDGKYTSTQYAKYQYANACYQKAQTLQETYAIYTLGFFHSLSGDNLDFARTLMNDLQNAGYHDVNTTNDLEFAFGAVADDVTSAGALTAKTFRYAGYLEKDRDSEETCYYSDSYFWGDSRSYNSSLATMSLCFELTTWSSNEGGDWTTDPNAADPAFKNARDLLVGSSGLGFQGFAVNSFWGSAPTKDSIGAVAANKVIKKANGQSVTLVALGVRGGGYGQEWASNFTLGDSGDHDGFAEARDNVLSFLSSYVSSHNITGNIKLWIVGYSRGGGVANMVAGALDDKSFTLPNVSINTADLYAYTFEAPQGEYRTTSEQNQLNNSGVYSNIHNTVNLTDIVPMVAPSFWNFWRNNRDSYLPSPATSATYGEKLSNMLNRYRSSNGDAAYTVNDYTTQYSLKIDPSRILSGGGPVVSYVPYEVSTNQALIDSATFLFDKVVGSRTMYYNRLQSGVREILGLKNGGSLATLPGELLSDLTSGMTSEKLEEIISPLTSWNPLLSLETRAAMVEANVNAYLIETIGQSDLWGSAKFLAELGSTLATLLVNFAANSLVDWDVNLSAGTITAPGREALLSLVTLAQQDSLLQPHYPEVTLAWMMSLDKNYDGDAKSVSVNGTRIIRINCPVDVQVYDGNGTLVAYLKDDTRQDIDGSSIPAYVNGDGEKIVMLPPDGDYTVKMTATGDGQVYYSVDEYSYDTMEVVRTLNYAPVTVTTGDVLTGIVPAFSSGEIGGDLSTGSTVTYQLLKADGSPMTDLRETTGSASQYTVAVSAGDWGYVSGGGTYTDGSFAQVTAYPYLGGSFLGWYDGTGTLVSDQETYRFPVYADTDLTAQFTPVDTYSLTVTPQTGGTVENFPLDLPAGVQIQVTAEAQEGYTFAGWTASAGTLEDSTSPTTWFTMPEGGAQVTARFTKDGETDSSSSSGSGSGSSSRPTSHTVETPAAVSGGAVTVSPSNAAKGTSVTVTPAAEEGYVLNDLTVTDGSGTALPLTDNGDGTYTFVMPSTAVQVSAAFAPDVPAPQSAFSDVAEDAYYADAVQWAVEQGVTNGTGSGFSPSLSCTRAQMVTFLWRASGSPSPTSKENPFTDLAEGSYYYDAVLWALEEGITKGVTATTFAPDATVSRAQTVTFLHRAAGTPDASAAPFSDVKAGAYYESAVSWAVEKGITKGTGTTKFSPNQDCTRAQIVTFLYRYLGTL